MTTEELWYSSYRTVQKHGGGEEKVPPTSERMSRKPVNEQWLSIIDLAIEIVTGEAGWRHATISLTGERYWFFRGGWWLLPNRMEERARLIVSVAQETESHRSNGVIDSRRVATLLRRWKMGRRWWRIAAQIPSLRPNDPPKMRGKGKKKYVILP